jgi:hypothetical protein
MGTSPPLIAGVVYGNGFFPTTIAAAVLVAPYGTPRPLMTDPAGSGVLQEVTVTARVARSRWRR